MIWISFMPGEARQVAGAGGSWAGLRTRKQRWLLMIRGSLLSPFNPIRAVSPTGSGITWAMCL